MSVKSKVRHYFSFLSFFFPFFQTWIGGGWDEERDRKKQMSEKYQQPANR